MISIKQLLTQPRMKNFIFLLSGLVVSHPASASCGASFCLVNTDWAIQGAWLVHGMHLDLRYEQVRQDQLMRESDKVNANQINLGNREVETRNHRWLANLDYGLNEHWGFTASLPFLDRSHEHTENGKPVTWNFRQIGDARILARYQTALFEDAQGGAAVSGFNLGLKLPTGKTTIANDTGTKAERSLQPGTGSTDLLAGFYYRKILPNLRSSWFVQASIESPLTEKDGFRPGSKYGFDLGIRTDLNDKIAPMLQLNLQRKSKDSGSNAEPDNSGGSSVSLSPGISIKLSGQTSAYGFVQIPLRQSVNGTQLVANRAATFGLQSTF
ncbi:hypothetical protein [Undibacterium sp. Ji67W]|uniref:hypothetical protein n=1 Tax=Undibacterium sp. Ji67W TaxID=3413042 RepID=UPI003BF5E8A3